MNDCPICLSENIEEINGHADASDMFDSSTIFRCKDCGTTWQEGYIILVYGEGNEKENDTELSAKDKYEEEMLGHVEGTTRNPPQ